MIKVSYMAYVPYITYHMVNIKPYETHFRRNQGVPLGYTLICREYADKLTKKSEPNSCGACAEGAC